MREEHSVTVAYRGRELSVELSFTKGCDCNGNYDSAPEPDECELTAIVEGMDVVTDFYEGLVEVYYVIEDGVRIPKYRPCIEEIERLAYEELKERLCER